MKRWIALATLLVALSACSGRTVVTADVDVLSFLDEVDLSQEVTVPGSIEVYLPDADDNLFTPDGGYLVDSVPLLDQLTGFGVRVEIELENTGSDTLDIAASFRLAPASDSANIYDGNNDVALAEATASLAPGATQTVVLEASLAQGDPNLDSITSDGFRIGLDVGITGSSTVRYRLTGFALTLSQRPFDLIVP
ncbi:hypothetical protein [Oceanithermus sp.]